MRPRSPGVVRGSGRPFLHDYLLFHNSYTISNIFYLLKVILCQRVHRPSEYFVQHVSIASTHVRPGVPLHVQSKSPFSFPEAVTGRHPIVWGPVHDCFRLHGRKRWESYPGRRLNDWTAVLSRFLVSRTNPGPRQEACTCQARDCTAASACGMQVSAGTGGKCRRMGGYLPSNPLRFSCKPHPQAYEA